MGGNLRVSSGVPNTAPETYRLAKPSKPYRLSPQGTSGRSFTQTVVFCFAVSLLFFSFPFLLLGSLSETINVGSVADWGMFLLTAVLGAIAVLTYRANEDRRSLENDLKLRKEFTDLMDRSLNTLKGIESITDKHGQADQILVQWDVAAQLLDRALSIAEKVVASNVIAEVERDIQHYQLQFNAYFQNKPITHFFDLEFFRPFIVLWVPYLNGEAPKHFSPLMLQGACACDLLANPKSKQEKQIFEETLLESFLADLAEYQSKGWFQGLNRSDLETELASLRGALKTIVNQSNESDRETSPLMGYVPNRLSFNTIVEFCSDLGEKVYSREHVATQIRGYQSLLLNPAEALYIQLNEFKRLPCGGFQAKRFPELKAQVSDGANIQVTVPFLTERAKKNNELRKKNRKP